MMICDLCDFHVAHTYCAGFSEFPDDWLCRECQGIEVVTSSEGDEPEESEESYSENEASESV